MHMKQTVLIAGTHDWRNDDRVRWYTKGSPFVTFLEAQGVPCVFTPEGQAFAWSSDLGGVGFGEGDQAVWAAAGRNLFWYCVPPRCPQYQIPPAELNLITHSHGLQVALFAAAEGLKINTLIDVAGPERKDMREIAAKARQNITYWRHIHSDASDKWLWLGGLFDGRFGISMKHSLADVNDFVPGVGHSDLLRDPKRFPLWLEQDRLVALR
jgi:hypothetical protein